MRKLSDSNKINKTPTSQDSILRILESNLAVETENDVDLEHSIQIAGIEQTRDELKKLIDLLKLEIEYETLNKVQESLQIIDRAILQDWIFELQQKIKSKINERF